MFLAKFFPFSERSGLNVVSEFNLDNLTAFGVKDESSLDASLGGENKEEMEVDDKYVSLQTFKWASFFINGVFFTVFRPTITCIESFGLFKTFFVILISATRRFLG